MNNTFLAYILRLLRLEPSIERATARQSRVITELEAVEKLYKVKAQKAEQKAEKAKKAAEAASLEATDAAELATNWKNSGLIRPSRQAA